MNKHSLPPISTLLKETPRIIIQQPDSPTDSLHFYHSPLLSPIDSYASSITRSPSPVSPISLPPLQGDDPPRPLKQFHASTIKPQYVWNARHSHSPTIPTPSDSYFEQKDVQETPKEPEEDIEQALPPFTQIILSETGQAILKRRRGRPPNMKPYDGKNWTFLTPTVWDVNHQQTQAVTGEVEEDVMHGTMAAFTSSSMDMVLQMPRKKRGRKPKSHIQGHSCFVWKDVPSKRTKKI
jgi:hypothetical protein